MFVLLGSEAYTYIYIYTNSTCRKYGDLVLLADTGIIVVILIPILITNHYFTFLEVKYSISMYFLRAKLDFLEAVTTTTIYYATTYVL